MTEHEEHIESPGPQPLRVGVADVARIAQVTAHYRSIDYPRGGGACREDVEHATGWGEDLLAGDCRGEVRPRLLTAVADLHNVAGWIWFDTGVRTVAGRHWKRALELASDAGNDDLAANVRYRIGRSHLHHGSPDRALPLFDVASRQAGSPHTRALLGINQAWAHAELGNEAHAMACLSEATNLFTRSPHGSARPWSAFFDRTDFTAMTGLVHTRLGLTNRKHVRHGVGALITATQEYGMEMARSLVFSLIGLATAHLLDGDPDEAERAGVRAVRLAQGVESARIVDRMRPLARLARRRNRPHLAAAIGDFAATV